MSRRRLGAKEETPIPPDAKKGGVALLTGSLLQSDEKLIGKIVNIIKMGAYPEAAAAVNDVGYSTLRSWVLKGKEHPESLYGAFNRAIEKAISEAETIDIAVLHQHANGRDAVFEYVAIRDKDGHVILDKSGMPMMEIARNKDGNPIVKRSELRPDWRAAAWKLERRNPKRWGRWERAEAAGVGAILEINPDQQAPTERDAITPEMKQQKLLEFRQLAKNLGELDDDEYSK